MATLEATAPWEDRLYPECNSAKLPYKERLAPHIQTLTTLDFRRSRQAEDAGYVMIWECRPKVSPARWIHPDQLPLLEEIAAEIAKARAEQEIRSAARRKKAAERARAAEEKRRREEEERRRQHEAMRAVREAEIRALLEQCTWLAPDAAAQVLAWAMSSDKPQSDERVRNRLCFDQMAALLGGMGIRASRDGMDLFTGLGSIEIALEREDGERWGTVRVSLGDVRLPASTWAPQFWSEGPDAAARAASREIESRRSADADRARQAWTSASHEITALAAAVPDPSAFWAEAARRLAETRAEASGFVREMRTHQEDLLWPAREVEVRVGLRNG
jgi:hypothetical protein